MTVSTPSAAKATDAPGAAADRAQPAHYRFWPHRVPYELPVPETTLWYNLEVSARRYPDRTALIFFGRRISYAELEAQAETLAGWLQHDAGLKPGERVLLMMQNSPQFVIAFYAVVRAGGAVVPVNPISRADELAHYIPDPSARLAICAGDLVAHMLRGDEQLPAEKRLSHLLVSRYADLMPEQLDPAEQPPAAWHDWLTAAPELPAHATRWSDAMALGRVPAPDQGGADDLVAVCYTSGTTGRPKGCMHTHRSIGHNTVAGGSWTHGNVADVSLGVVPMFHITGMQYAVHIPIWLGSTNVVMPRWDRELAGRIISRHRVTSWTNIPTMIIDLLGSPNIAQYDLSSLRQLGGGGAAMPQAVAARLEQQFGLKYMEGYGLTETAAPSHSNPPQAPKQQCLGIPFIGTDSRIVDPVTLQELPQGETGEIVVHGPQVFKGYWERPADTEAAFFELDGKRFFRTGDLGRIDEDGYFFITDRLKRMINASGYKVWPAEVETMLFKHPAVLEACVIGTRDAYRGESVKAVIVLRDEARGTTSADDIRNWAREHMAAYKVPNAVEFVDSLPKSGSGKVMWRLLQEKEGEQPGAGQ
ncbi:MAG TPA: long-chain fatty acid--CoA ligase [Burkholderiaceae bacterium]|nr:long-chain fatty acid--CoA ligase [Burkholderiaceae bacterium]